MGTALHHAVDLLATLPKNNPSDALNSSDYLELHKKTTSKNTLAAPQQFLDSMDRILEQCNKESVRMTILKQEKTFKEQVRELHRLYQVQKMLMAELRNNESKPHSLVNQTPSVMQVGTKSIDIPNHSRFWSTGSSSEANHFLFSSWSLPSNQANSGCNFLQSFSPRTDLSSQEQSTSCSRETLRMPRGFNLELPAEENNSTDISAVEDHGGPGSIRPSKDKMSIKTSPDSHFCSDGDADVELTLSIGLGTSKKKPSGCQPQLSRGLGRAILNKKESWQMGTSTSIRSDPGEECSSSHNSMGSPSAAFDRESLQQPSWLFQTLRLNGT